MVLSQDSCTTFCHSFLRPSLRTTCRTTLGNFDAKRGVLHKCASESHLSSLFGRTWRTLVSTIFFTFHLPNYPSHHTPLRLIWTRIVTVHTIIGKLSYVTLFEAFKGLRFIRSLFSCLLTPFWHIISSFFTLYAMCHHLKVSIFSPWIVIEDLKIGIFVFLEIALLTDLVLLPFDVCSHRIDS